MCVLVHVQSFVQIHGLNLVEPGQPDALSVDPADRVLGQFHFHGCYYIKIRGFVDLDFCPTDKNLFLVVCEFSIIHCQLSKEKGRWQ